MRSTSLALGIAIGAISAVVASASSISYTTATSGATIVNAGSSFELAPGGAAPRFGSLSLPGFVPGNDGIPLDAILTSVSVTFSGVFDGTLRASGTGSISGVDGWGVAQVLPTAGNGVPLPGFLQFTGGTAFSVTLPADYNCNSITLLPGVNDAYCRAFSGTIAGLGGPYNPATGFYDGVPVVSWNFGALANDTTTSAVDRSIQGFAIEIDGRVQYTWTTPPPPTGEIPVPAALPLLATALGGLGLMRRYRKRA